MSIRRAPILPALLLAIAPAAAAEQSGATTRAASAPAKPVPSAATSEDKLKDAEAKRKGLVRFKEDWVPKEDLPYLERGLVRYGDEWVTPDEKQKLEAGWRRHDEQLIPPDEAVNIDKGLYKVGDAWLPLADADAAHASEANPWVVRSSHFVVRSTIPRADLDRLVVFAEGAVAQLAKVLGQAAPAERMPLVIIATIEAANEFAQRAGAGDHSSVFPGYVLEADPERPAIALFDGGAGKGFSHLYVAHAAAHKFLDAAYPQADRIPEWFSEGLAAYVDRYLDPEIRRWAIDKLVQRGGLSSIDRLSDMKLVADDAEGSQRRLFEAGLVMAYFAEGPDKADADRFKKAIEALKKVAGRDAAIQRLLSGGADLEKRVRSFAGIGR